MNRKRAGSCKLLHVRARPQDRGETRFSAESRADHRLESLAGDLNGRTSRLVVGTFLAKMLRAKPFSSSKGTVFTSR